MSLEPARTRLTIQKGATYRKRFTLYTDTAQTQPWDFTNYTASLDIYDTSNYDNLLLSINTENNGLVLGGTQGTIDVFISDSETGLITWRVGHFKLSITGPLPGSNDKDYVVVGSVSVKL